LGLVVQAAHLHHGLRGAEADGDLEFCRELAAKLAVPFHERRVDVGAEAKRRKATIEEAAREVRYEWFQDVMAAGDLDAVATAHTLDDQAETVLGKLLRGAWTEGLGGIHPVVEFDQGKILRPMLGVTRHEIEAWLGQREQLWREDSSNQSLVFTRNRLRHQLLPLLEEWNPRLKAHLAQMAELARDEEAWWQKEIAREEQRVIAEGKPVRGGGRGESHSGLAVDLLKFAEAPVALQRRLLRAAAEKLGVQMDFAATEKLRRLAIEGRSGERVEAAGGLRAERTARELRLAIVASNDASTDVENEIEFEIPGMASGWGVRLKVEYSEGAGKATLRNWKAGDRVRLRYSSSEKKVKEVLERMNLRGSDRSVWPVLEFAGRIVWMRGVEVEETAGMRIESAIED
jgi:tRNA(Ile)-lysidine synthase